MVCMYMCSVCGVISYQRRCPEHRTDRATQKRGNSQGMATAQWKATTRRILSRDHHSCQIRGPGCTHSATQVDHIQDRQAGGTDQDDNLRAACAHCNLSKGARSGNQSRRRNTTPAQRTTQPMNHDHPQPSSTPLSLYLG